MKRKTTSQNPVTEEELKRALMPYVTKEDFGRLEKRIEGMFTEFSNTFFTAIDPLMKELEVRRAEREIAANQVHEIRQELTNHEKRITKLEKAQQTA